MDLFSKPQVDSKKALLSIIIFIGIFVIISFLIFIPAFIGASIRNYEIYDAISETLNGSLLWFQIQLFANYLSLTYTKQILEKNNIKLNRIEFLPIVLIAIAIFLALIPLFFDGAGISIQPIIR